MTASTTRILSAAVMLAASFVLALGAEGDAKLVQPLSASGRAWVPIPAFSDEFDGDSLDLTKWDNDIKDWGNWSWEPENARVEGGRLLLRMQYHEHATTRTDPKIEQQFRNQKPGDRKLYYTSGEVRSKAPPIKFGYFEARIKTAPLYPGVSPAFWLYRNDGDVWTEMDWELTQSKRVELNGANCFVFQHPKLQGNKTLEGKRPKISEVRDQNLKCDPRKEFHVYGIEWDESEIKWYFDGKLMRTRQNEYWDQPLDLIFSLGLRSPYAATPSPKGFPTQFEVDYVRAWQRPPPATAPATPTTKH